MTEAYLQLANPMPGILKNSPQVVTLIPTKTPQPGSFQAWVITVVAPATWVDAGGRKQPADYLETYALTAQCRSDLEIWRRWTGLPLRPGCVTGMLIFSAIRNRGVAASESTYLTPTVAGDWRRGYCYHWWPRFPFRGGKLCVR